MLHARPLTPAVEVPLDVSAPDLEELARATRRAVARALAEDLGDRGDVTSLVTVPPGMTGTAEFVARADGTVAGLAVVRAVFDQVDARVAVEFTVEDGDTVVRGDVLGTLTGPLRSIFTGERTALNFLCHLSGIATRTRAFVAAVEGTGCAIRDTRKTTPGLRLLEKAAVRAGGGHNHRVGLYDGILIKDNHIAAAGSVTAALEGAQRREGLPIQIEVSELDQLEDAIRAGATDILLDNFSPEQIRQAVQRVDGRAALEASGRVTLDDVRRYADAGVGRIAIGGLTHSAPSLDIALDVRADAIESPSYLAPVWTQRDTAEPDGDDDLLDDAVAGDAAAALSGERAEADVAAVEDDAAAAASDDAAPAVVDGFAPETAAGTTTEDGAAPDDGESPEDAVDDDPADPDAGEDERRRACRRRRARPRGRPVRLARASARCLRRAGLTVLLAVDVGNSNTVLGLFQGNELVQHWRTSTDGERTSDEMALLFQGLLGFAGLDFTHNIHGVVVSSVVPTVTEILRDMISRYFPFPPIVIEPGVTHRDRAALREPARGRGRPDRERRGRLRALRRAGDRRRLRHRHLLRCRQRRRRVRRWRHRPGRAHLDRGAHRQGRPAPQGRDPGPARRDRPFDHHRPAVRDRLRLRRPGRRHRRPHQGRARRRRHHRRDRRARARRARGLHLDRPPRRVADAEGPAAHLGAQHHPVAGTGRTGPHATVGRPRTTSRGSPVTDDAHPATPEGDDPERSKLDEIMATRRQKIADLRAAGVDPFPVGFTPTDTVAEVVARWADIAPGQETGEVVRVAGRIVGKREMGKLRFLPLREDGVDIQLFVPLNHLDDASRELVDTLDAGDWVGVEGEVMASKKGELSVKPSTITLLGKSIRPLPDKHGGLTDVEQRYRQRELDLVVNEETRRTFRIRSQVLKAIRAELDDRGFVEVETPMLHPIPGGATARPFVTHHNTLDTDLYLRIAPELYLKRLIAGGFRRVFEINRSFRNEGMSPRHNPEFTMLETYEAYADHEDVMALTESLVQRAALEAVGTLELTYGGRAVDLSGPWRRVSVLDLTREATGRPDLSYDTDLDELRRLCDEHEVAYDPSFGPGKLVVELYEKLAEGELWEPTFVTEHPVETSPLARRHRSLDHVTERFELLIVGRELANAFSELTDPDDQRGRFEAQARAKAAGDDEAMPIDEPYLRAMELGMPPTGGLGLGIDRLVMLVADVATIRDVILFPTLRPEA